ncbi:MAG: geranylgeranylglycerol-phosphate geranylgeranyltransferase [Nitrososphaerota archaeon]|nr:geranylgeranylglycerol-phosphate geranylgeranyltransferase [Candidatus Bathyarchaeota archaeon]MDW8022468.1 geranylgeranylglycerol-phosphate geranylgeranyltransferase [Nitrososphaerota archaeon]
MNRFASFIHIMRPVNCLMMGFAVLVGAALANSNLLRVHLQALIFGFFTGFLLTAASMVINDYYDREIDAVNEPSRPIPSGLIKPKEALIFAFLLTALGLAAAFLTSPAAVSCFLTALIFWIVSVAYVTAGKRTGLFGNFLVSACVSAPFVFGSLAVANEIRLKIWIFVLMVFFSNTGREITKGIVDVQGDKMQNVKTLAVRYGERKAAFAAAIFYLLAVALTPLPLFLNLVTIWFVPPVAVTDVGLLASSVTLLRDYSRENARKVKNHVLAWFLVGLIAFVAGSIA